MKPVKFTITLFTLLLVGTVTTGAVELAPTPIQDQMATGVLLMSSAAGDQFEDLNNEIKGDEESPVGQRRKVSVLKAAALSALLPGLGEYYVGHRTKARYFFGIEAVTWVSFVALRTYGSWKKDDLIRYAAENANAQLDGKDDAFLDLVGFYGDIYEYNSLGRVWDPERPYLEDTPENHWLWESEADQDVYREIKNSSREAYRRSDFMIGVAIVNRLISIIDAVRDAKRAGRRLDNSFPQETNNGFSIDIDPLDPRRQLTVTVFTPF